MKTRHIHFVIEEDQYQKLRKLVFSHQTPTSMGEVIRRLIAAEIGMMEQEPPEE